MKKLHICLVGDNGVHFQRWIKSLSEIASYKISAITLHSGNEIDGVDYYYLNNITNSKLDYLLNIPRFRKLVRKLQPDILHCHYASGYGFLGALSGVHPYFLSVWGSDVVSFPSRYWTKKIMIYTLNKADAIFATSHYLKSITEKYTSKDIYVINFGIDTEFFTPQPQIKNEFYIGTVKSLQVHYGINTLISAFGILVEEECFQNIKLLIVGGGALEKELKDQVDHLGLNEKVIFTGKVDHSKVPYYHNLLDIFVAVSRNESFGVSVLEAQACEKPVVVSDVGGLPEVVESNVTGFIVPPNNPEATADALRKLLNDPALRNEMGLRGRKSVLNKFQWQKNVEEMISFYNKYHN